MALGGFVEDCRRDIMATNTCDTVIPVYQKVSAHEF